MFQKKDYRKWHDKKSKINDVENRPSFHVGEVWFCYLGENVGFEQDGNGKDFLRPVAIVKKFNNEILWGIPLTKAGVKHKKNIPYYYNFSFIKDIESVAILSQIRLIDAKRLAYKIGDVRKNDFVELIKKLKELFP